MTLLIETMSRGHAMLTADGLSVPNAITGAGINRTDVQKIFPLSLVPIAIAHHGINLIDGREVRQVVVDFEKSIAADVLKLDVLMIAEKLRDYVDADATKTFSNRTNKGVIGFWITGFGPKCSKPELYEIVWLDQPNPQQRQQVTFGGAGQKFIKSYLKPPWRFNLLGVNDFSEVSAGNCHAGLYKKAEAVQKREREHIFGGHQHRLLIRKNGWLWLKKPVGA